MRLTNVFFLYTQNKTHFHVFFLNCYPKYAKELICEACIYLQYVVIVWYTCIYLIIHWIIYNIQAANHNLTYPNYAWITYGGLRVKEWTKEGAGHLHRECTEEKVAHFLYTSRVLSLQTFAEPESENVSTDVGLVRTMLSLFLLLYSILTQ